MTFGSRTRNASHHVDPSRRAAAASTKGDGESCAPARSGAGEVAPPVNPAWQAMVGVQAKLAVSAPGDPGEVEADRVADAVVNDAAVPTIRQAVSPVSRKCAACGGGPEPCPKCEEEERLQRKANGGGAVDASAVTPLSGGSELPAGDRTFFESRMGHDFGDVRVHTDRMANTSAASINARAYTQGNHIAFASGEYDTGSTRGRHLLGHELTHVVQQRGGTQSIQRSPGPHEEEIERSKTSPGKVTSSAPPLLMSVFNFAINEATLKAEHQAALEQLADLAVDGKVKITRVVGHTDSFGDDKINGPLSNDRAMMVEEFLHACGASVSKVDSKGAGSPVADNGSEVGRSRNRRVDIFFDLVPKKKDPPPKKDDPPPKKEDPPPKKKDPPPEPDYPGVEEKEEEEEEEWEFPDLPCVGPVQTPLCLGILFCILNPELCALPFLWPKWPGIPDIPEPKEPKDPKEPKEPKEPEEPEEPEDPQCGDPQLPPTQVSFIPASGDRGNRVEARPLTKCPGNTVGSEPDIPALFPDLWDCIVAVDGSFKWVHAHLLHGETSGAGARNLHGPGDDVRNIIFADRSINGRMSSRVEKPALDRVWDNDEVLWYEVEVNHFTGPYPRGFFAETIDMEFGSHDPITGIDGPAIVSTQIDSGPAHQPPHCDEPPGTTPPTPEPETPTPEPETPTPEPDPADGYDSTIEICHLMLKTRPSTVTTGDLSVEIDARWLDATGNATDSESCPITAFDVTLWQEGLLFDTRIQTVEFPVGQMASFSWTGLEPGQYYFLITTDDLDPDCCLAGSIRVRTPGGQVA
jgi:outer membrane protein OmpA-like peptidoglycan-associated protein